MVTLSEKRMRLQGVANHRSSWLPLQDLVKHRLVPMTSVARTLVDFDGFADHGLIRSTFDDDRQRGNVLTVAGWLMLHFTSNSPPAHIVGSTRQALALRATERAS